MHHMTSKRLAGPCRGHKFTLWKGGIRVPCVISMPGQVPRNQVRDKNWKLVKDGDLFLSNMDQDITETKNLADQYPDIVEKLKTLHEEWSREVVQQ